jgi:hypothetical protein
VSKIPGRSIAIATLLLGAAWAAYAGGWSIITINDFPEYALAGKPLTLTFAVRQHGNNLVGGLKPKVHASTSGGLTTVAFATPTSNAGEYSATLSLASPGDWTLRVDGGFNADDRSRQYNSVVLPPLRVISDASTAPEFSEAERGSRLLVTKGCVGCHTPGSDKDVTRNQLTADYLKTFLADPSLRKVDMPNLRLKEAEISALIAFINRSGGST